VLRSVPTGCKKIDERLGGGIPNGEISLVYGEAETGKTTLAMQCAVNCAIQGYKTLFLDCDSTFSGQRLLNIAPRDFQDLAELIILMRPQDFVKQAMIIDQITDYVTRSFGLIVVETLTSLYLAEIAEKPEKAFDLNRELNRQMACLAQIAKIRKIAVLTTSQVRSVFDRVPLNVEPVATRVLKFWSDTIIFMKPTKNPQVLKVILDKNPRKLRPLTCYLKIEENGITECLTH